jgi:hypothetical protein
MNSLAFNMHISRILYGKYQFVLAVLPIGLMFASLLVLQPFAYWLSSYIGIPEGAPVKDHPNGIIWIVIFLIVMLALMISGYLLGWFLNAMIARIFLGWDADKTRRVFLFSDVPNEWLKDGINLKDLISAANEKWAITRQKGMWNFILTKGVFGWGMYFIMVILPVMRGKPERIYFYFIWQALLWGGAGSLFGGIMWYFSEKQYIRQLNNPKP